MSYVGLYYDVVHEFRAVRMAAAAAEAAEKKTHDVSPDECPRTKAELSGMGLRMGDKPVGPGTTEPVWSSKS